jgi:hypothetical protein
MLKERDLRPGLSERFSGDRQRRALEGDRSLSEGSVVSKREMKCTPLRW